MLLIKWSIMHPMEAKSMIFIGIVVKAYSLKIKKLLTLEGISVTIRAFFRRCIVIKQVCIAVQ